jgi:hypothetical protein
VRSVAIDRDGSPASLLRDCVTQEREAPTLTCDRRRGADKWGPGWADRWTGDVVMDGCALDRVRDARYVRRLPPRLWLPLRARPVPLRGGSCAIREL